MALEQVILHPMTEAQQRAYDQAQVMLAFSQGKKIEFKSKTIKSEWVQATAPMWNFTDWDYRIAPEPQEVWLWVKEGKQTTVAEDSHAAEFKFMTGKGYTKKLFREVLP